jgi:hypothetical protein
LELDIRGIGVMIAIPVNRDMPWQTARSLIETVSALEIRKIKYSVQFVTNGSIIQKVRSILTHSFLKSGMDRIFWIDSDMSWSPEAFMRLLGLSTVMDVVGATYPAKRDPNIEFMMSLEDTGHVEANQYGCVPVKGMGLGFTVVNRRIIKTLADQAQKVREDGEDVAMIFRCGVEGGVFVGEDIAFFGDCRKLGATVFCDPSIKLGHVGGKVYEGSLSEAMRKIG